MPNLLLKTLNQTYRQFLQGGLKLLVVGGGGPVHDLLLAAGGALATDANLGLELLQLFGVHAGAGRRNQRNTDKT